MVSSATPGIVIAAPASGTGKTTIATGLIAALARFTEVAPFKVGPDYIDPGYHTLAAGRVGRNLDSFMCTKDLIGPLYAHGSAGCEISVVEGVMGLFDGRIGPDPLHADGSTAEIAALLGMPVILVIDARHMSQSVAALVHGFATLDEDVHIAGVIVNRVGSPRHADIMRSSIEAMGIPVLGAIPRVDNVEVPSRHLGLVTAAEGGSVACEAVQSMADLVEEHVDIQALLALATCTVSAEPWDPVAAMGRSTATEPGAGPTIAMAGGPAFTFSYAEHVELLEACGARVAVFDPLVDDFPECDGLVVPGGFPEEHVDKLGARTDLAAQVREAVARGIAVHGECAGLLWLLDSLDGYPMCGVLPGDAVMSRLSLGYRDAVAVTDSALATAGTRFRGHEFHKTQLTEGSVDKLRAAGFRPAWGWYDWQGAPTTEGIVSTDGRIHASYLHIHPVSAPQAIAHFVDTCAG
ncbi:MULTISPECIES: cobyrinate a,c-diamide synthase [unclassified Corynebacterium]|uniref:cobyrinate a,c-diamide synthase n=1 Tax=unclassified Corynebacterium TaxID=2624378 RepID=UPI0030B42968